MLLLLFLAAVVSVTIAAPAKVERSPLPDKVLGKVVGILTQKTNGGMGKYGHSYIAASYVKYLESAGAQVVPVFDSSDATELNHTLHNLNGILLPGGAQIFPNSQFYKASKFIYDWAKDQNGKGMFFPIWGTCLGFEAILYAEANQTESRFTCSAHMANNITLSNGASDSRMLKDMDSLLYQKIQSESVVANSHGFCFNPNLITDEKGVLTKSFNLLATNWDANGKEYIALVEHKTLPIYASQFHPEKSAFEWSPYVAIPHSKNAISFMQYLANFFLDEVTKNQNKFDDSNEFYIRNINNYQPVYTLLKMNSTLESCYFFKDKRPDWGVDTADLSF